MGNTPNWRSRHRKRRVVQKGSWTGFEPLEHNMFTFEGQLEQMSRFARSVNNTRGWRRWVGKAIFALPLWVKLGAGVLIVIAGLLRWAF